jgi:hypothetical protein
MKVIEEYIYENACNIDCMEQSLNTVVDSNNEIAEVLNEITGRSSDNEYVEDEEE